MGSRGRSIRLRIYFLVAIPLVAMVGLLAYVAGTSISNAISLDRSPNLVNATAIPAAKFSTYVQAERAAAVLYLFRPTAANLQAYQAAIAATQKAEPAFTAAMNSQGTVGTETASGIQAIKGIEAGLGKLPLLREGVQARALTPLQALAAYSQGLAGEAKLFLLESESVVVTDQLSQAIGLIAKVQAWEELSQEDALLAGMLAVHRITRADRVAFTDMAATRQADDQYADYILSPANLAIFNASLARAGAMQQDLAGIEQAIAANAPVTKLPITEAQWQALAGTLLTDTYNGGVGIAQAILVADHQNSHAAWVKVAVTSGIALLGLLITILVTTLVARGIIRRLGGLERSALTLAEDQLPDVIARLRRGEDVDVASEAPPLRVGEDEIGRVGRAFGLVRQSAIAAAVDEAKLRRGLNDVFRSLARRSQSLLHRQLTLLDQMERRATDPEALDDLFRLDHLTTRMRRHAEGLVILAGAPPGRGWSSPVRMVDVMRGAIAEVEDYARVSVATRSRAALAGSAVADVIHLLAELIENATTLSPPYTSVRVMGDMVANGFAIEVEDRGLGMSPQRLAELNERLARPPEFNPSDSEQLGLFVVSQLAKRHGIRMTLRASPYGGTTAIVLVPPQLVVAEEALRAGLPGEPVAITAAHPAANGHHAAPADAGLRPDPGLTEPVDLPGLAQTPGVRISGALRRWQGTIPERLDPGAHAAPALGPGNGMAAPGPDESPGRQPDQPGMPARPGAVPGTSAPSGFDVFTPRRHAETPLPADSGPGPGNKVIGPGPAPAAGPGAQYPDQGSQVESSSYPAAPPAPYRVPDPGTSPLGGPGATPFPQRDPAARPGQPASIPGWTVPGAPGASAARAAPGAPAGPPTPMTPVAPARPGRPSGPPWELPAESGARPANGRPEPGSRQAPPGTNGDIEGLPRRVKQANLAPQLRADPPRRRTTIAGAGPAAGPTPAEVRQTMSALQRGWQEGRSQQLAGTAPGQPGPAPPTDGAPASPSDADTSRGDGPTADNEARGESDGR